MVAAGPAGRAALVGQAVAGAPVTEGFGGGVAGFGGCVLVGGVDVENFDAGAGGANDGRAAELGELGPGVGFGGGGGDSAVVAVDHDVGRGEDGRVQVLGGERTSVEHGRAVRHARGMARDGPWRRVCATLGAALQRLASWVT